MTTLRDEYDDVATPDDELEAMVAGAHIMRREVQSKS